MQSSVEGPPVIQGNLRECIGAYYGAPTLCRRCAADGRRASELAADVKDLKDVPS